MTCSRRSFASRCLVHVLLAIGLMLGALATPSLASAATADVAWTGAFVTNAPGNQPTAGDTVQWTMYVVNYGPETVPVTITDQLGAGETFVSASAGQGSCTQTVPATCDLGNLAPGVPTPILVTVVVTQAGPVTHSATLSAAGDTTPDNTGSGSITVDPPQAADPPFIETGTLTLETQARLVAKATLTPRGSGTWYFQYGATRAYGKKTVARPVSGDAPINVKGTMTGLAMNTTYQYRAVLVVGGATYYGANRTGKTVGKDGAKAVTIKAAVAPRSTLVTGKVVRPFYVDAPGSCSGTIRVQVYTNANRNLIARTGVLKADCTYSVRVPFGRSQAAAQGARGFVRVQASFSGNRSMVRQGSISPVI